MMKRTPGGGISEIEEKWLMESKIKYQILINLFCTVISVCKEIIFSLFNYLFFYPLHRLRHSKM